MTFAFDAPECCPTFRSPSPMILITARSTNGSSCRSAPVSSKSTATPLCLRRSSARRAGIAVERALATLEREHHAGELLRDTIVELLRDAPPFVRGRSLNEVGGCRLLQHPREVLAKRRDEVGLGRRVRRGGAPEDEDAQHHAGLRAADRREQEVRRRG